MSMSTLIDAFTRAPHQKNAMRLVLYCINHAPEMLNASAEDLAEIDKAALIVKRMKEGH